MESSEVIDFIDNLDNKNRVVLNLTDREQSLLLHALELYYEDFFDDELAYNCMHFLARDIKCYLGYPCKTHIEFFPYGVASLQYLMGKLDSESDARNKKRLEVCKNIIEKLQNFSAEN